MSEKKIVVGITQGDFNGIGLETIIKTFIDPLMLDICTPVLFGSQKTFSHHRKTMNVEMRVNQIRSLEQVDPKQFNIFNVYEDDVQVEFGKASSLAGEYALKSIKAVCDALENKKIDVLVTAPINKHTIQSPEFLFKGHTDYLEMRFKSNALMLMVSGNFRVGVATEHLPLSNVTSVLTAEKIIQKLKIMHKSLLEDFGVRNPKIAVLGLNPHAGDNGTIGAEEQTVIEPAILKAKTEGVNVWGPYSADGFFGNMMHQKFDAVLAMYHDQGLVPFKTLAFDSGVNYTAGLSIIRTSPDHGVGYDIAGMNKANEASFRSAIYLACDIFTTRKEYKEITSNPLKSFARDRE